MTAAEPRDVMLKAAEVIEAAARLADEWQTVKRGTHEGQLADALLACPAGIVGALRRLADEAPAVGKASEIGTVEVEIEDGAPVYRAYTSRLQGLEAAVRRGPRLPTLQSAPTWYDSVAQDLVAYVEWHAELRALLESEE